MSDIKWTLTGNTVLLVEQHRSNPIVLALKASRPFFCTSLRGADFVFGECHCGLLLSLKYHLTSRQYIFNRVTRLPNVTSKVLILLVDCSSDLVSSLTELCLVSGVTLLLANSPRDAARWMESLRSAVQDTLKAPSLLEAVSAIDPVQFLSNSVPRLAKKDVNSLFTRFGSLKGIANATVTELSQIPGIGPKKGKRIHKIFHTPFISSRKRTIKDFLSRETEEEIVIESD
ncbi:hypothetical protein RCL1_007024 [Eukaryota sp. TZLM3-RCL]